jgi:3'(2'), 5'-bisphosphate nucleotidase
MYKDSDLKSMMQYCCVTAHQAAKIIIDIYNTDDFDTTLKQDQSPITKADKASNDFICKQLTKLRPHIPIITEENAAIDYEIRKNYTYFWLVDPLDGTKEFVNRNGEFTINIALIYKEKPIMGIVFVPVTNTCYLAIKQFGAYKIENCENLGESRALEKKVIEIRVSTYKLKASGIRFACSRSHPSKETMAFINKRIDPVLIPTGSALKFMLIAEGKADMYPRFAGKMMEWDTAAAQIIVEEAGGFIIDRHKKKQLSYNTPTMTTPDFICSGNTK